MINNTGIYYIQNKKNKLIYIGQSRNIKSRWSQHLQKLRNKKHPNPHLQNSYNKYGESVFEFGVLEYCSIEDLDDLEIAYIKFYNTTINGYNLCEGGRNTLPDNRDENHGMWRDDISNEELRRLYLGDYTSKQLAEYFSCSRRTINRRLKKIFGSEYEVLKRQKQLKGLSKCDRKSSNIKDEDILNLVDKGYNSVEISDMLHCSDTTVMYRLKRIMSSVEYNAFKKKNMHLKMENIRKKCFSAESKNKRIEKVKKYSLWDVSCVRYHSFTYKNKTTHYFYLRYEGRDIVGFKGFKDFVSPQIVYNLIVEFID